MAPSSNHHNEEAPTGWVSETRSDEVHSWVGPAERLVCTREENDEWMVYSQPRSELGAPTQVQLTHTSTDLDQVLSVAFEYMKQNSDAE
jgi:hypothetical protein